MELLAEDGNGLHLMEKPVAEAEIQADPQAALLSWWQEDADHNDWLSEESRAFLSDLLSRRSEWPDYSDGLPVLLAEACNASAKALRMDYYELKPLLVEEALYAPGVTGGWGRGGAFYLYHPSVGTVSFHSPNGDMDHLQGKWEHPWSGVSRQFDSFCCLIDPDLRAELARATAPVGAEKE